MCSLCGSQGFHFTHDTGSQPVPNGSRRTHCVCIPSPHHGGGFLLAVQTSGEQEPTCRCHPLEAPPQHGVSCDLPRCRGTKSCVAIGHARPLKSNVRFFRLTASNRLPCIFVWAVTGDALSMLRSTGIRMRTRRLPCHGGNRGSPQFPAFDEWKVVLCLTLLRWKLYVSPLSCAANPIVWWMENCTSRQLGPLYCTCAPSRTMVPFLRRLSFVNSSHS
jgi:hypothetical protein